MRQIISAGVYGGRAEGVLCAEPGARTPIVANRNLHKKQNVQNNYWVNIYIKNNFLKFPLIWWCSLSSWVCMQMLDKLYNSFITLNQGPNTCLFLMSNIYHSLSFYKNVKDLAAQNIVCKVGSLIYKTWFVWRKNWTNSAWSYYIIFTQGYNFIIVSRVLLNSWPIGNRVQQIY